MTRIRSTLAGHGRRILASYLRAVAGVAATVEWLDSLRSVRGVLITAAMATIPAVLRAIEGLAAEIEPTKD